MRVRSGRDLMPLLLAAAIPALAVVYAAGLLAALPLLLLLIPIAFGCYPGEQLLERISSRRAPRPRPERAITNRATKPRQGALLRSRLLIAASLADRPPPPLSAS
jgi:hypothetical protein